MRTGYPILVGAFLIATGIGAPAQFTDPIQRKDWFDLQRTATDVANLEGCRAQAGYKDESALAAYMTASAQLAKDIGAYLDKYPNGRGSNESIDAYRYRVWSVTLRVGREKATPLNQLNPSKCQLLTAEYR